MKAAPEKYRLKHGALASDASYGNNGFFVIPHFRIDNHEIRCQVSDGEGWEHVSVTIGKPRKTATRCPTWEEMCWVKDQFWNDNEVVIQYHPRKEDYVSMHHFCLHLWRPTSQIIPIPNSLMVGINVKEGEDMAKAIQKALHDSEDRGPNSMNLPPYQKLI